MSSPWQHKRHKYRKKRSGHSPSSSYKPLAYPTRRRGNPLKTLVEELWNAKENLSIEMFAISCLSLIVLVFGLLRIGTWANWLSLPWIQGWGEYFIGIMPFEIFFVILGAYGIFWVVRKAGLYKGSIMLLSVAIAFCLLVIILFPNAHDILFWQGKNGERMEELVNSDIFTVTVGADGHKLWLHNNPESEDPTWEELQNFLAEDTTDQIPYDSEHFVCADFAELLHNNAEKAGIRAAYVSVSLTYGEHALNAFNTVDNGLVFIDDVGSDCVVDLERGKEYVPISLFSTVEWYGMGTIYGFTVQW